MNLIPKKWNDLLMPHSYPESEWQSFGRTSGSRLSTHFFMRDSAMVSAQKDKANALRKRSKNVKILRDSLACLVMIVFMVGICGGVWAKSGDSEHDLLKSQLKDEQKKYSELQGSIVGMANPPQCARRAIGDSGRRVADLERKIAAIEGTAVWKKSQDEKVQQVQSKHRGKTFKTKKHWWEV